jgi:hypothetical protein
MKDKIIEKAQCGIRANRCERRKVLAEAVEHYRKHQGQNSEQVIQEYK